MSQSLKVSNMSLGSKNSDHFTDLCPQIKESYTPAAKTVVLDRVYDYKDHYDSHIDKISGHSCPLCFKFQLVESRAFLQYRHNSSCAWITCRTPLLKV